MSEPLLTIVLQDENTVPEITYKGEKISLLQYVQFGWVTKTDERCAASPSIVIQHVDSKEVENGKWDVLRIERGDLEVIDDFMHVNLGEDIDEAKNADDL
ncbi:hypothetical protein HCJ66_11370 [Listeria sp. FSL L7-1582]|uniref:hypothetical protein n=1 Tax=Listeria portnoyi TaxID=2713504 RepID=UPI00164E818C|nr:hypothetical protein [Listeria portnoyi]MBC6310137.1 hypothetical protein [Listeria portnoyi]